MVIARLLVFEQCADATNRFLQPVWFRQEACGLNGVSVMTNAGSEDYTDTGTMLHNPTS
jgi:hypothetical protein